MKYIRTYESNDQPQITDYVYCQYNERWSKDLDNYLNHNIGYLYEIKNQYYNVRFDDHRLFKFTKEKILYWSKNKENVQLYIDATKYNL